MLVNAGLVVRLDGEKDCGDALSAVLSSRPAAAISPFLAYSLESATAKLSDEFRTSSFDATLSSRFRQNCVVPDESP